jgi:hypothetical protein
VEKEQHLSSDIVTKLRDDARHVLWSQDRVRLYAADYIERLEAVVRAADEALAPIPHEPTTDIRNYVSARARVNLPEIPDSSFNPATLTSQSQAKEADGTERKGKP